MASSSGSALARCAEASGLITREQISQAQAELRAGAEQAKAGDFHLTDELLADRLVALGHINSWQASQLLLGRTRFTLGPYRIVDSLGQGGMGQVFLGEHEMLSQVRAIKVLPISKSTPQAIAGFKQEIRAQATLNHPHLVQAYDAGEDGNVHYLVSEYVEGMDLRKLIRREGRMDAMRAAAIGVQVADALRYAHEEGFIHRDVKPSNVLVAPNGLAKLSDLGLAGPMEGAEDDTRFGKIVGSADYIAPDHILSPTTPSPLWDIYSLGCTLYYAVTGKPPFPRRGSSLKRAMAHIEEEARDPRELAPDLDEAFALLIMDLMAKDANRRVPSASAVLDRLRDWFEQSEGGKRRASDDGVDTAVVQLAQRLKATRPKRAKTLVRTTSKAPAPSETPPSMTAAMLVFALPALLLGGLLVLGALLAGTMGQ